MPYWWHSLAIGVDDPQKSRSPWLCGFIGPVTALFRMNVGVQGCHVKGGKVTETSPGRCFTRIRGQLESTGRVDPFSFRKMG